MKEKLLSVILKEIRFTLSLSQAEMASTLGMKEQMYALYERGNYDDVKNVSIRRQKLLGKIEFVKNKILIAKETGKNKPGIVQHDFAYQELERKVAELERENKELMQKVIALQEHTLRNTKKKIVYKSSN